MATPTPLSSSIFRRGGTKQELFNNVQHPPSTGAPGEEPELVQELEQMAAVLQAPKAGHDLSAAIWRPSVGAAELVLVRRETGQPMGFRYNRRRYLHIEEAVFLVDRADMLLFVEQEDDEDAVPGYTVTRGASCSAQPLPRHRLLSMQECFELMELCGVSMERYIVYSTLSRSGYLVMRLPTKPIIEPEEKEKREEEEKKESTSCTCLHVPLHIWKKSESQRCLHNVFLQKRCNVHTP
ncbi:hypothetical protein DUNSADRAFT_10793 [Dunaliella salina]|uniref:tRNA-splicing endonuclease subunit Sen54 N-terminal domain-containing protein n=1 Tax=Dunaliella salina TaxID=3046 RepID=A0ABQ7H9U0_DUNSA|nr:hypothetical protein DUNSADRAFT_10793 [Dunaliella salina]|eukprot:KAF5843618.1 hypothetical protein DUNSADRAFT_10793 [Dunaliella salina]